MNVSQTKRVLDLFGLLFSKPLCVSNRKHNTQSPSDSLPEEGVLLDWGSFLTFISLDYIVFTMFSQFNTFHTWLLNFIIFREENNPIVFSGGQMSLEVIRGEKPNRKNTIFQGMNDGYFFHTWYKDLLLLSMITGRCKQRSNKGIASVQWNWGNILSIFHSFCFGSNVLRNKFKLPSISLFPQNNRQEVIWRFGYP